MVRHIPSVEQIIRAPINAADFTFVHEYEQEVAELLNDMPSGGEEVAGARPELGSVARARHTTLARKRVNTRAGTRRPRATLMIGMCAVTGQVVISRPVSSASISASESSMRIRSGT